MRHTLELTPRLRTAADLVPAGARLADIGTDHAYLPAALLLEGKIPYAIAADLRHGPLLRAKETAAEYGCRDRMGFRLCDGLKGIRPEETDAIVIAGMGGETIAQILAAAPWVRERNVPLVLQPMSSLPDLREWLFQNGYQIEEERLAREEDAIYVVMSVRAGEMAPLTPAELWAGRQSRDALRGLTVSVAAGERVAVLGNNGAGKSTFFLLANGVLQPRAGQVIFEGAPVRRAADLNRLRRGVGLVFQDPDVQLLAGTVEQEVSFGPMNLRLPEDEVARRVDEALAAFGLEAYRQRAPQYLSGGEKKRVTLADVLAMDPRLLLLDEPAASLDPAHARLLEQNLARLSGQGLALVVATHDVDFAWRWAERVLLFHNGQLAADGTPETIFADRTLLATCGLEQPVLFRAGRALGLNPLPRTVEQLEQAVGPKGDAG